MVFLSENICDYLIPECLTYHLLIFFSNLYLYARIYDHNIILFVIFPPK